MSITIKFKGNGSEISVITEDLDQALAVIDGLNHPKKEKKQKKQKKEQEVVELTPKQLETYEFLVANDSADGVSTDAVAQGLGITYATAYHRLYHLVELGVAHKVGRSSYRHGDA